MIATQSGNHTEAILKQARRRKDKATVEQLEGTAPDYTDRGIILYVNLFLMCEAERKDGFAPIPLTSMLACINHFGLDDYQEDFLLTTFAIADPIVLTDRRSKHGNAGATVDPNARPRGTPARDRRPG